MFNIENLVNNQKLLINVAPYTINTVNLKNNDYRLEQIINTVQEYDPQNTILVAEGDSPYIKPRTNFIKNSRHLNYYLPEYPVYYIFNDRSTATRYYWYYQDQMRLLYQSYIPIKNKVENVLLITDDYNYEVYNFRYVNNFIDEALFYKDISNQDVFEYLGYNFVKQY